VSVKKFTGGLVNQAFNCLIRGITGLGLTLFVAACGKTTTLFDRYGRQAPSPLETTQSLVGTTWSQKGASEAFFFINRSSVEGSDGCNGFGQEEENEGEAYFIFAPDGTIKQNASFFSTLMACDPWPQGLSSYPCSDWKSYRLYGGKLSITTADGSIHTFTQRYSSPM